MRRARLSGRARRAWLAVAAAGLLAAGLLSVGLVFLVTAREGPPPAWSGGAKPPEAGLDLQPGAELPLQSRFLDSSGNPVSLGEAVGGRPTLLVPGYYRCRQLCGLLVQGLLEAANEARLAPDSYRVLRVSIDPSETPADARARREADLSYARFLQRTDAGRPLPDLRLLTGPPASLQALARALGLRYERSPAEPGGSTVWSHAAAVIVVTPKGRVSGSLGGVRFEPAELRAALAQAAGEGRGSLSERVALLCSHFDPRAGRHSAEVMLGVRLLALGFAAALVIACWRSSVLPKPDGKVAMEDRP